MNADSQPAQITNFQTSDGVEIEAELRLSSDPRAIAVLSHPHPLYGGEMRNNVVQALFDSLPLDGIGTLRYNFRGVGNSGGSHGNGALEVLDSQAAFAFASQLAETVPVFSVGYSFGADVSLAADDCHCREVAARYGSHAHPPAPQGPRRGVVWGRQARARARRPSPAPPGASQLPIVGHCWRLRGLIPGRGPRPHRINTAM